MYVMRWVDSLLVNKEIVHNTNRMYDIGSSTRAFQSTSKLIGKKHIRKFAVTISSSGRRSRDHWQWGKCVSVRNEWGSISRKETYMVSWFFSWSFNEYLNWLNLIPSVVSRCILLDTVTTLVLEYRIIGRSSLVNKKWPKWFTPMVCSNPSSVLE